MITNTKRCSVLAVFSLFLIMPVIFVNSALADRNNYHHRSHHNDHDPQNPVEEETVFDEKTGLTWQKDGANGPYTWEEALEYVETLNNDADGDGWAGCRNWYLPTSKELARVIDHFEHIGPRINTSYFTNTQEGFYWTSTSKKHDKKYAVSFEDGKQKRKSSHNHYWVRAVHGDCDQTQPIDMDGDGSLQQDDCNDYDANIYPGAPEICDGRDNDCNPDTDECLDVDNDGDGYTEIDGDCDDHDINNFSGNSEVCDGADNDCDGVADNGLNPDADGDGFTAIGSCDYTSADDCDDTNATVHPGAAELVCGDLVDQDCDGEDDNGLTFDIDNDGYTSIGSCGGTQDDCNDSDAAIHNGASEICDGLDNNCNSAVDEGLVFRTYYQDSDSDYYGNAAEASTTCDGAPSGYVLNDTDCNDTDAAVNPGVDGDSDGASVCTDCDDADPNRFPGNAEVCDGVDNDCNDDIDDGIADIVTGSDIGECQTGIQSCIDGAFVVTQTQINASPETCDGLDNNCDGTADNGIADIVTGSDVGECQTGIQSCIGGAFAVIQTEISASAETCDNLDNNCDGSVDEDLSQATSCGVGECGSTGVETCSAGSWVGDTCVAGTPVAETCDNLDNNCDGSIDEDLSQATSCGVGECGSTGVETCAGGSWVGDTCVAGTPAAEVCDTLDNNCDGYIDDDVLLTFYQDSDQDGYGDPAFSEDACSASGGFVDNATDCNDSDDTVNPGAIELCDDTIDNNCDGVADEGCSSTSLVQLSSGTGFDTVWDAYNAILGGTDTIEMQGVTLNESLMMDLDIYVTLKGGFDDAFTASTGWTTISNPGGPAMTVRLGTVLTEYIKLR
ncbi:MAG TPA: MopE-related protein [Balneolales bacterium]|nr:MopE-related protein [Balneolales bacterium]